MDHYENPQNVGSFDKEDPKVGTGTTFLMYFSNFAALCRESRWRCPDPWTDMKTARASGGVENKLCFRSVRTLRQSADTILTCAVGCCCAGLVGAPACGDVMKLQIKVSDDGKIEEAVFKVPHFPFMVECSISSPNFNRRLQC